MSFDKSVSVAVVQATPVIFDRDKSVEKCLNLITDAAVKRPGLILFPESFIPAYPRELIFGTKIGSRSDSGKFLWELFYNNSISVPGKETDKFCKAARDSQAYISLGITEREGKSLYCTQLLFSPAGKLVGKHRKIKPTAAERIVWGEGDGASLTTHKSGNAVIGTLICWENYMPHARMAMYQKGVNIYLAPTADNRESWQNTLKHIALEGRCFVIGCNQFVRREDYPDSIIELDKIKISEEIVSAGGSCVVSPDGEYLIEPVWNREEIIYAELEIGHTVRSSLDFDPAGHYNRPDIFQFVVRGQPDTTSED